MKKYLLSGLLAVGLASCGQSTVPTANNNSTPMLAANILGFVKITFTNQGNGKMDVSTESVEPDGKGGFKAQTLSRPPSITVTSTTDRGAVQDNNYRYMYATLSVNNNGAAVKNLTLLGVNIKGSSFLYDTSLTKATRIDGTQAPIDQVHQLVPINTRISSGSGTRRKVVVNPQQSDFQAYSEDYVSNITKFMNDRYGGAGNATAFPYGFVARNSDLPDTSRSIPNGAGTGQVSVAFATPDTTPLDEPKDIKTFSFLGLITADANTTASADVFETSLERACGEVQAFGGSEVHGFTGQTASTCTKSELENQVRIAGDTVNGSDATYISYGNPKATPTNP